jgi:hypothetical protein
MLVNIWLVFKRRLKDGYSMIALTNLFTNGAIKSIDKKTRGHPSMKLDGHCSKNILAEGV